MSYGGVRAGTQFALISPWELSTNISPVWLKLKRDRFTARRCRFGSRGLKLPAVTPGKNQGRNAHVYVGVKKMGFFFREGNAVSDMLRSKFFRHDDLSDEKRRILSYIKLG